MTDIKEIPVDPPESNIEEIEDNININEEITNIPEPETPAVKKKVNRKPTIQVQEVAEQELAPKKGRGRPAGAKNKAKTRPEPQVQDEPDPEPIPRRPPRIREEYYSPPPVDPTVQLLNLIKNQLDQRQANKIKKYAGWVGRF